MSNTDFTLRNQITNAKNDFLRRYGVLDWRWEDEGIVWTIQDYHSCMGSTLDFTDDDWAVCLENGITVDEVKAFCEDD